MKLDRICVLWKWSQMSLINTMKGEGMDDRAVKSKYDPIKLPRELSNKIRELAKEERRTIIVMIELMYEQYMESLNAHQK